MKTKHILAAGFLALATAARADTFGSGGNAFTIDFVNVGNAGNANDTGAGGGSYSSPYGGVAYNFRMGVTEVPQVWIDKATNLGMTNVTAGAWTGSQPAAYMTWYESAAFVNYLNTSTGHQAAYNLTFSGVNWSMILWSSAQAWQTGGENLYRNKDAYYFLPSENEWYKAAYHKNDGVTANYWDYATASNTIPTAVASGTTAGTAVYYPFYSTTAAVDNDGGLSAYGTQGQNGNVWEWQESAFDGLNNSSTEDRVYRGGGRGDAGNNMRSSIRSAFDPAANGDSVGLRVASIAAVPEPASAALFGLGALLLAARRRWRV